MSRLIHPNQLAVMLAEREDLEDELESKRINRALRFLEGIDTEDEALRLRRRRRAQRSAVSSMTRSLVAR